MSPTFASLGVPADVAASLARRGITEPFPIQAATIPDGLAGLDLCGKAPTGSGKTIAFGVPMVARVKRSAPKRPKGLVLAPTRELALQVADELRAMSGDLRVLAVYGGAGIEPQIKQLRQGVDIVVACPGRLLDLMDRKVCDLRDAAFVVVDEADRMADMGFLPDVRRILDQTSPARQTVLFSATLDGVIDQLVREYQTDPIVHEMAEESAGDTVHHFWVSERPDRVALLAQVVDRTGPTIVFCRTKHGSDRVARQLGKSGVTAAAIHGNRSQSQRERALRSFHQGEVAALVATDVAARGIHVEGVQCVVHYDLPADHKDYIHRSGRTGRAGADGTVVALLDKGQRKDAVKLKKAAGHGDVEIGDPDVGSLPEGPQQAFRRPPKGRDRERVRADGEERRERPASDRRSVDRRTTVREQRPLSRSDRPASTRTAGGAGRDATGPSDSPSRRNRAVRRRSEFTDAERIGRAAANEARRASGSERSRTPVSGPRPSASRTAPSSRSSTPSVSGRGAAPNGEGGRSFPVDSAAGHKVRASGASRRKAKREALVAAGEDVPRAKKRRSGKPRSPAASRRART